MRLPEVRETEPLERKFPRLSAKALDLMQVNIYCKNNKIQYLYCARYCAIMIRVWGGYNNKNKSIFIAPTSILLTGAEQSHVHIIIVLVIKMLFEQEWFEIFTKNTDKRTVSDVYRGWHCTVLVLLYKKLYHHMSLALCVALQGDPLQGHQLQGDPVYLSKPMTYFLDNKKITQILKC